MRTVNSHLTHYISVMEAKPEIGVKARVCGISSWDMPSGNRLIREMSRCTELRTVKELVRWARKYPDVSPSDIEAAKKIFNLTDNKE